MKHVNPISLKSFLLTVVFFFSLFVAEASHLAGGYIKYTHLGGLQYSVTLTIYRDCSGINLNNETLYVTDSTCGVPQVFSISMAPTRRDTMLLFSSNYNPAFKCSGQNDPNFPDRPINYELVEYTQVITLPRRSKQWVFWWTQNARPQIRNLDSGNAGNVYLRATLNNLDFDNNNSSLLFNRNEGAINATAGYMYFASSNTIDPDNDSLSYRLIDPMIACTTKSTYKTELGFQFIDTSTSILRVFNANSFAYSAEMPIPSFLPFNNITGFAEPYFDFNAQYGSFAFWPRLYQTPLNSADGSNKYIVSVEVTEYRRSTSGVMLVAGSSIREFTIQVNNFGRPTSPPILNIRRIQTDYPGLAFRRTDSTLFRLEVPQRAKNKYKLSMLNPTNTNLLIYTRQVSDSGLTVRVIGQNTPAAYLELYCNSNLPVKEYTIPVTVYDDKYPVRSTASFMLRIKVVPRTVVVNLQASSSHLAICEGDSIQISAPQGFNVLSWSNGATGNAQWIKDAGTFKALVTSDATGEVESQTITITKTLRPQPSLTLAGSQLGVNQEPGVTYQWYQDGRVIAGATQNTLNMRSDGTYYVVANRDGCTSTSDPIAINYFAILNRAVGMYPSPAQDKITLTAQKSTWDEVTGIQVVDVLGRSVLQVKPVPNGVNEAVIDLANIPNGQYRLLWLGTTIRHSLVVQR